MRSTTIRLIPLLLLPALCAFGQPRVMTLEEAKQFALERNLNVVQARNNEQAAQANVLSAYGNYLPTLSASGNWSRTQLEQAGGEKLIGGQPFIVEPVFQVTGYYSAGLSAGYTLFDGFAREARLNSATSGATATELGSLRTRQSVVFQVETSYLNVLRNEQLVKVSEENLKRDQRQLERISESNKVGASSLADVYRQQSQVSIDEYALITAQNNFNKAKADLMALIGVSMDDDITFADASMSTEITRAEMDSAATVFQNFRSLTSRALVARPDYIAAKENLDAAESGVTSARSSYFPSIGASAGYNIGNSEFRRIASNRTLNWGIGLRWTLFDGFQTNQAVQLAVAQRRTAEVSLAQTELNVNVDVKKALLDLDAAGKQYDSAQKGVTSAEEDRKIAEERYNLGAGTLLDLLTANATLVQAQANKVNAAYNYIIAKLNVTYVVGERSY